MVKVTLHKDFQKTFSKVKDNLFKTKIIKQIEKIKDNPRVGKPMRNVRKGTRELYIPPFRLSYRYDENEEIAEILDLYHKKFQ
ncbi:MAG: type II toxin-antitoxin system RelE/ParE family toxin [Nanoarchaeota archaeon]|nr:type II toxin-antitoxin system RelE/ParE family toxin [Nanoarchaeota archaeon]